MPTIATFPVAGAPSGSRVRGWWLDDALAGEPAREDTVLRDDRDADVCIVGAGYTGLWTALALKERSPDLDVAVLEADICGGGASGRNGGFVMTWWSKFGSLVKRCGVEAARELGFRAQGAVDAIGAFCAEHDLDAGFHKTGWLWAATNPTQVDAWMATVSALDAADVHPYEVLDRGQVAALSGSPAHIAGIFEPEAAIVNPARLVRGMYAVARRRGIHIFERSPVRAIEDGSSLRLRTPAGTVRARQVILATNAWSAALPDVREALVVVSSDVIATAPAPDRLAEIGWELDLGISDSRRLINYYRPTDDGRVVFGKGGGTLALNGRVTARFTGASNRIDELHGQLQRVYPMLWDVPVVSSWRGPIDYSVTGLPFFARLRACPDVIVAAGFSGNGVGPSYVAGQTLAEMALHVRDDAMPEALTKLPTGRLPREPIRFAGGILVRSAIARKERSEDNFRRVGRLTRTLAAFDPTSTLDSGGPAVGVGRNGDDWRDCGVDHGSNRAGSVY